MKHYLLLSLILIGSIITFLIYFFHWRLIEFSFVKKIEIKDTNVDYEYDIGILSNCKELESCLTLMPLKLYKENGLIKPEDFDFEEKDYLISYGRALKEIKYNWYYALFIDRYYSLFNNSKIPIKAVYEDQESQMAIFIYSLSMKQKYRGIL